MSSTPSPAPIDAPRVDAATTESDQRPQPDQPATDAPPVGGPSTPAADAHDAALDQEVDTFGVIAPESGPVS